MTSVLVVSRDDWKGSGVEVGNRQTLLHLEQRRQNSFSAVEE